MNPVNDYTPEAPATGSGAGRADLATQDFQENFARSSSFSSTPGLNYVAWGTDGVSWTSFEAVDGKKTGHAKLTNISFADLQKILERYGLLHHRVRHGDHGLALPRAGCRRQAREGG